MSNAGITIYNNSGHLQIDDTYSNLYLLRKMKLSDWTYDSTYGCYVNTPQTGEVCYAFGCKDRTKKVSFLFGDMRDGNGRYVHPENKIGVYYTQPDSSHAALSAVDVYAFGVRDTRVPSHGQGLCVYDANGKAVYCSEDKSMRVLYCGNSTTSLFYGNDKDVALIYRDTTYDYVKISGGSWTYWTYKRNKYFEIGNGYLSLITSEYSSQVSPPQYEDGESHEGITPCILIDVTGY